MVIYEVNLSIVPDAAEAYGTWLRGHIAEILAIDGFLGARWMARTDAPGEETHWTIHYTLRDRRSLERYLSDHAPAMREDGLKRFPGMFTATRRIFETVAEL